MRLYHSTFAVFCCVLLGIDGFILRNLRQKHGNLKVTSIDQFSSFDLNKDGRVSVSELIKAIPMEVMQEGKFFLQSRNLFTHSRLKFKTVLHTLVHDLSRLISISDIFLIFFLFKMYKPLLQLLFKSYNWLYGSICKSKIISIDPEFAYENSLFGYLEEPIKYSILYTNHRASKVSYNHSNVK